MWIQLKNLWVTCNIILGLNTTCCCCASPMLSRLFQDILQSSQTHTLCLLCLICLKCQFLVGCVTCYRLFLGQAFSLGIHCFLNKQTHEWHQSHHLTFGNNSDEFKHLLCTFTALGGTHTTSCMEINLNYRCKSTKYECNSWETWFIAMV